MGTLAPRRHLTDRDVVETGHWQAESVARETAVGTGPGQTVLVDSTFRPCWLTDFVNQLRALSVRRATRTGAPLSTPALQKAFTFLN